MNAVVGDMERLEVRHEHHRIRQLCELVGVDNKFHDGFAVRHALREGGEQVVAQVQVREAVHATQRFWKLVGRQLVVAEAHVGQVDAAVDSVGERVVRRVGAKLVVASIQSCQRRQTPDLRNHGP